MIKAGSNEILVEVKNLSKHFGKIKAVNSVSFNFVGGEVHGFIGPNGAGKTTTMRVIATLDPPTDGDVLINGVSSVNFPDRVRPIIGFMPDYLDSYKDMIVEEYLDFYARAYELPPRKRKRRLADVIDFTSLSELLERPVDALSKGMKQRLSLARVLVNDPKILILDEPAAGLDPRARIELRNLIRQIAKRGKAIFISSHILTELSEICDSVTIIEKGKIHASDAVGVIQKSIDVGTRVEIRLLDGDAAEHERLAHFLAEMPGVLTVKPILHGAAFTYEGEIAARVDFLKQLLAAKFAVTDFHSSVSDLEDAFLSLTEGKVS
ncbi:MAG: ABC transporter ATP-binding protein [Planctomycetes bacterium]|nr:ABC transporter ATP-binding protein [Planctomycetota bacterium]